MIIGALDYSISSPGVCKFELNENLDIIKKDFLTFTASKKYEKKSNIIYYNLKKDFKDNIERKLWLKDHIINFLKDTEYLGIEDYAFSATGKIFDIAEGCGITKSFLYNKGIKLRLYDPPSIKKFATLKGNADKILMEEYYEKNKDKFNLNFLPMVKDKKSNNPKDNVIDAFFIGKLLQLELKIRYGIVLLKDLNFKHIEIFNQISKAHKINLLVRDFIEKREDEF